MSANPFTESQQAAITATGNVLVVAGAGTGKTHTLVERCCSLLLEGKCSLDEILMVTFTEAAAAEMRKRIRARLAEKASGPADARLTRRLEEQLALLDTACISTLHSFCLRLIREHFHDERLRLDPEFVVLSEEQVHQMRNAALDALLEAHYGGDSPDAREFQKFVTDQAGGSESRVRELIWRLHRYSRSLAHPAGWFEKQLAMFSETEPVQWREWLRAGFGEWRARRERELEPFSRTPNVADCVKALLTVKKNPSFEEMRGALKKIQEARDCKWPRGAVGAVRDQIKEFFSDAAFLASLLPEDAGDDPLAQDWGWARGQMQVLLRLAREFGERFDEAKRETGGVDFTDLEQFALRLLWETNGGRSTSLAQEWQTRLKYVFVDEYQDINEAQDAILRALSREGADANRFLVGDVKQSIYRFRLADPKIFQGYKKIWGQSRTEGQAIPLSHNFRSREAVLDFVNSFFAFFMREEIGGVAYDAEAHLKFGAPESRAAFSRQTDASPEVEIHLRTRTRDDPALERNENGAAESVAADFADLDETEKEARLVALQLKKLRREKAPVWDDEKRISRAVEWRDMVVLLRSPRNKAEIFAREFNRAGVPLHVKRESFYSANEVSDLLSLLQLLDNPMQDLPLLAVLRSPLAGLSVDELAIIRAAQPGDRFWAAVLRFRAARPKFSGSAGEVAMSAGAKVKRFLTAFDLWRRHARQGALSDCMRRILDETHFESLVLAQDRGEERLANVNRLLRLLRRFDPYQRQGLLRFLRFVEAQRDAEAEEQPASPSMADAVRLFSIHQSKGLEFPVVALADLSKAFNISELHADVLLDAEFGLCPRIAPPDTNARYPSLPYWLARQRQKKELLGEELRLLYVAMTRARDRLLLIGGVTEKQFETRWHGDGETSTSALLQARSYADWLAIWFAKNCALNGVEQFATSQGENSPKNPCNEPMNPLQPARSSPSPPRSGGEGRGEVAFRAQGETHLCRWRVHDDASLVEDADHRDKEKAAAVVHLNRTETERLRQRLSADYPFAAATNEPAKTSVSALRRRAMEFLEQEEAADFFKWPASRAKAPKRGKSAAETGTVYHRFLERVPFERVDSLPDLRAEAERMVNEGVLSPAEARWLDFDSLLQFWRSQFGRQILANSQYVRRELAFTARFSPAELAELSPHAKPGEGGSLKDEFVVVQGVADLAVILPKEIWLLDFKTDDVSANDLAPKLQMYGPQLKLYAAALERIYGRPVTECRLHFLACGATIPLPVVATRAAIDSAATP